MRGYNALVDFDKQDYSGMIITDSRDVLEPRLEIGLTMEQHAVPSENRDRKPATTFDFPAICYVLNYIFKNGQILCK